MASLVVVVFLSIKVLQRVSDGPIGPLQGGNFTTGELIDATTTDFATLAEKPAELLLVGPGTSRTLGFFMHDGIIYISCDLGFIWNRLEGSSKYILNLIYIFKDWHEEAVVDGRAELRIEGRRYAGQLTRVEDEALLSTLKTNLEEYAREFLGPEALGPIPPKPNDIWFFRFDPVTHHVGN